jgi:tetratricopeptide (TPR) repeat protein
MKRDQGWGARVFTMSLFRRRNDYHRDRLIREAREFQRRKKHKKALALLRRVMAVEPNNVEVHALIAPSLAVRGLDFSAWESYSRATAALLREGKNRAALDFYRDATRRMPRHYEAWTSRAALERRMERVDDARQTIEAALPHFRRRATRYPLISLLRSLLKIDGTDRSTTLELACVLSKTGQRDEALTLLKQLAQTADGPFLRKVRRIQWNVTPSLAHSWLWLRSCMSGS